MTVNGILLLYHDPLTADAAAIMEHVNAFEKHSRFRVWKANTALGLPPGLNKLRFNIILLHYSVFAWRYHLTEACNNFLDQNRSSYRIAFFQDEYHECQPRFDFLNRHQFDCVYTLVEPEYWDAVYRKYTRVPKLVCHFAGYVSEELIAAARRMSLPDDQRTIDVGYRARPLPFYMGQGAQEKTEIARLFCEFAKSSGLKFDISTEESKRIYGPAWHRFLANCRGVLGVEAGVSLFDVEDVVRPESERLLAENPAMTFAEVYRKLLAPWDGKIQYRMMSPRHFEAAGFRICQILFEGKYGNAMQPYTHYLPLKKDFSNLDEVMRMFKDREFRLQITENAYRDLIASGQFSYRKIIGEFDEQLMAEGLRPGIDSATAAKVTRMLGTQRIYLQSLMKIRSAANSPFPGRSALAFCARPFIKKLRRLRQRSTGNPATIETK